jgi:hypothetical protein
VTTGAGGLLLVVQHGAARHGAAALVGAMPPVTIRPTPPRALGVEGGHALEAVGRLFQAHVHRAHEHAVLQGGEAQVQGREHGGVAAVMNILG